MTLGEQIRQLRAQMREELVRLYSMGKYTHTEIGLKVGNFEGSVYKFYEKWKDEYNFPKPPNGKTGIGKKKYKLGIVNVQEAYKLYIGGMNMAQVGKRYGVSREYVRQRFKGMKP